MPIKKWNDYSQFNLGSVIGDYEVIGSNWNGDALLECVKCGKQITRNYRALMGRPPVCGCKCKRKPEEGSGR